MKKSAQNPLLLEKPDIFHKTHIQHCSQFHDFFCQYVKFALKNTSKYAVEFNKCVSLCVFALFTFLLQMRGF